MEYSVPIAVKLQDLVGEAREAPVSALQKDGKPYHYRSRPHLCRTLIKSTTQFSEKQFGMEGLLSTTTDTPSDLLEIRNITASSMIGYK